MDGRDELNWSERNSSDKQKKTTRTKKKEKNVVHACCFFFSFSFILFAAHYCDRRAFRFEASGALVNEVSPPPIDPSRRRKKRRNKMEGGTGTGAEGFLLVATSNPNDDRNLNVGGMWKMHAQSLHYVARARVCHISLYRAAE